MNITSCYIGKTTRSRSYFSTVQGVISTAYALQNIVVGATLIEEVIANRVAGLDGAHHFAKSRR